MRNRVGGISTFASSPADDPPEQPPNTYVDQTFRGRVILDGASFRRCTFRGALLVYEGGLPPRIEACAFENVGFQFAGAAGRTLAFLQAMAAPSSGFKDVFKSSFPMVFGH